MSRPDSAQIMSGIGTFFAFLFDHSDKIAGASCAAVGVGYTLWKWRRDAVLAARADAREAAESAARIANLVK